MSGDSGSPAERRARLAALLLQQAKERTAPLSSAQERIWFLEQLDPGHPTYHIPNLTLFDGLVDQDALAHAIAELARRHESLRTVYELADSRSIPRQRVLARVHIPLQMIDLRDRTTDAETEAVRLIIEDARRSFDLERGPLARASLYQVAQDRSLLLLTIHHIALDGWSLMVLLQELQTLYTAFKRGERSPLPKPPVQYVDYVNWQKSVLQGETFEQLKSFWRKELEGAPEEIALPADFAARAMNTHGGNINRFEVDSASVASLRALAQEENVTLYMVLLAAYATLLHRLGGQSDLVIGSPVANRPRIELESVVGLCANVIPLRINLSGDPAFRVLLQRTREVVLRAFQHQEFPFEKIVEELRPSRQLGRNPIFQVLFTLQNLPYGQPVTNKPATHTLPPVVGTGRAPFDISFTATEVGRGLVCSLEYSTERFTPESGEQMVDRLATLLKTVAVAPHTRLSHLSILSEVERKRILAASRRASSALQPTSPERLIAEFARKHPENVALLSSAGSLTYAQLEREVLLVARHLRRCGVGPEVCVASSVANVRDALVALLAILRAGGTYVPVDPVLPDERVALIVAATKTAILLTTSTFEKRWRRIGSPRLVLLDSLGQDSDDGAEEFAEPPPEAAAFIIFTSGSTGKPKGVVASRRGLVNHIHALHSLYPLSSNDSVLQLTPLGFDGSLWELLGPVSAGAHLVSMSSGTNRDPSRIVRCMADERITAIQVVPSLLRPLLDEPELDRCRHLRRVYCGGEPLTRELAQRFYSRLDAELLNCYGPTEGTIDVASWRCEKTFDNRDIPIGHPIPGVSAYVLDANLELVPDGVTAELYAGGVGVARGYLNAPDDTAERFVPDPFGAPGSRMYRTGDLARRRSQGELEFKGRYDNQIKLHGQRLELGEIESTIKANPDVAEAVVALSTSLRSEPRLVGLVVPRGKITVEELRQYLGRKLPFGAVPASIRFVETLPISSTGKIDRRAIAEAAEQIQIEPSEPPRLGDETVIAELWSDILKVERIGRTDSFFELGGHSLLAMQVAARFYEALGLELPLQQLFTTPTVSGLAAWVAEIRSETVTATRRDAHV
ncbi:MAG TPA: amino acid adenylation domain-containing protein [Pyrinomonadaceae bacterium]|nr:amino acid adenylation domain-containing protein [Pyrinomonadaceae bacterium]